MSPPVDRQPGVRHFLDLWRLDPAQVRAILADARTRKAARVAMHEVLAGAVSWEIKKEDAPLAEVEA